MSEPTPKPGFEELKAGYLQHLRLRNLSPLTLRQVDQYLRLFLGYATGQGMLEAGQVDQTFFERYKAYMSESYMSRSGKPLCSNTIGARLQHIQAWFGWMRKKGIIFSNPIADVRSPKRIKRLPRGVMRPEEIRRVMEQPDLKTPLGYRDRTIMEVGYATGIRAAEAIGLHVSDVNLEKKALRVRNGKGGRERFAPLSTPACRFLERYISVVRPELAQGMRPAGNNWLKKAGTGGDILFLSLYGGPFSRTWLAAMMKGYIRKAGITRPISPVHGFRHSVATHLIEDGMDVRYVQVLLGHDSINSTQIYTHVERKTLHRLLKAHHPRELVKEEPQPFIEERTHARA